MQSPSEDDLHAVPSRPGSPPPAPTASHELGVALALALGSFVVRLALDPWLRDQHPYTPAFAAVALAGWLGTWRAGSLCALVSFVLSNFYFVTPRDAYAFSLSDMVAAGAFFGLSAVILYFSYRGQQATLRMREVLEQLRQADARKAEFLSVLAHELRSPLSAMNNAVQILRSQERTPVQDKAIAILGRQVQQVARLTSDLLDTARIQQGKLTLSCSEADLRDLVLTAVEAVQPQLQARSQGVAAQVPSGIRLSVDGARMVQVFTNLLHNASKFSPDGSTIEVRALASSDGVTLRFTDHGVGIPPEKLEWVFDTYAQLGRGGEGLGLGLALVRKLVKLHGGTIRALSDGAGQGSTFELRLPAGGDDAPSCAPRLEQRWSD